MKIKTSKIAISAGIGFLHWAKAISNNIFLPNGKLRNLCGTNFKTSKIMETLFENTAVRPTFDKEKLLQFVGIFVPIAGYACIKIFKNELLQIFDFQNVLNKDLFSILLIWLLLAISVLYSYFVEKSPFLIFKETKRSWKFYLVSFAALFVLLTGSSYIIKHLGFNMHSKPSAIDFKQYPILILIVSATAGICEELIYRGFIMARLANIFGNKYSAIFLSAALFGSSHLGYGSVVQVVNPLFNGAHFRRGLLSLQKYQAAHRAAYRLGHYGDFFFFLKPYFYPMQISFKKFEKVPTAAFHGGFWLLYLLYELFLNWLRENTSIL